MSRRIILSVLIGIIFLGLIGFSEDAFADSGPIFVAGMAPSCDDLSNPTNGIEMSRVLGNMLPHVTNGGNNILSLGTTPGTPDFNWLENSAAQMSTPQVVIHLSGSAIDATVFDGASIIVITDGHCTGHTIPEYSQISGRQNEIFDFVNAGGGLLVFSDYGKSNYNFLTPFGISGSNLITSNIVQVTEPNNLLMAGLTSDGLSNWDDSVQNHIVSFPLSLQVLATTLSGDAIIVGTPIMDSDTIPPIITLSGNDPETVEAGTIYDDDGATAFDDIDGDITASVLIGGLPINTSIVGSSHIVTYDVADSAGNAATQVTRTVNVVDTIPPIIIAPPDVLIDATEVPITFFDIGFPVVSDNISPTIDVFEDSSNVYDLGETIVTWTAIDESGNVSLPAIQTITVVLIDDTPTGDVIDSDTTGKQYVGPDETLTVTNGATVTGKITVDGGTLILEDNCTITGNVKSKNGGTVFIDSCTVNGKVLVDTGSLTIQNDSEITKNVNAKNTDFVKINDNPNSFGKNIRVDNGGIVLIDNNHVTENLRIKNTDTVDLNNNTVDGHLRSFDNEFARLSHNTVAGNLNTRGSADVTIKDNTVTGNIRASGSDSLLIKENTSGENLRVNDNLDVEIDLNQIGKNLRVFGNTVVLLTENHADNNVNIKNNQFCSEFQTTADGKIRIKDCTEISPPVLEEASIDPISGDMGFSFTITDPQGRIQLGDMALFYDPLAGDADSVGLNADNIIISVDGTALSGTVPFVLPASDGELLVSVKVFGEPSRFADIPFQLIGGDCPPLCGGF